MYKEVTDVLSKLNLYHIHELMHSKREVLIFGACDLGFKFMKQMEEKKIKTLCFIDNNKTKDKYKGISVLSFNEVRNKYQKNVLVIIASDANKNKLRQQLVDAGFSNNISLLEFQLCLDFELIKLCYNFLHDKKSKNVLLGLIYMWVTKDFSCLSEVADDHIYIDNKKINRTGYENQYFHEGIIKLNSRESFLNVGTMLGRDIKRFIEVTNNQFEKIYGFEPNPLCKHLMKNNFDLTDERIKIFPFGVFNEHKTMNFSINRHSLLNGMNFMGASRIDHQGKDVIKLVKLDDILECDKITYITMDIEGAEEEALLGAENMIKNNQPKLAVSIYHKFQDLWKLPILLKQFVPNHRVFIRHHSNKVKFTELCETICYLIPDKL